MAQDASAGTEVVFGVHAVRHALDSAADTAVSLWVQEEKQAARQLQPLLEGARRRGVEIRLVSRDSLDRESGFGRHQGVLLRRRAVERPPGDLEALLNSTHRVPPLLLVLDGVQDPHNLGACLRTADAAGVDAVIIPRDRAASLTAAARKVASGAAEHTPLMTVTNLARALRAMRDAGIWVFGAEGGAPKSVYDLDLTVPSAICIGGEGSGLRHNIREHCDELVSLPMCGTVESLNLSVAAGICLYEAVRQRRGG